MNLETCPADLADRFKAGMRRLASGVSLITSGTGDTRVGLIATAVNSVSADPPTLLICVNQTASAHDVIAGSGTFCVNILRADSVDIAGQFSSTARRAERFSSGDWEALATGSPVLSSALVAFDCAVTQSMPYHSHTIFFGRIVDVKIGEKGVEPLIYLDRTFHLGASPQIAH
ncbi:flavin reductase family protein [Ensifer soli]|uniref:flavin reductase family protein n=1 Tax=Ciceribacter sp. sgz301302 TaxID=3342379 RepID=UPI0035BA216B